MTRLSLLAGPAVALAIGLFAGSAQAAPAGGALGDVKANPAAGSAVETTSWTRRCYWHRGHRHCRQVWVPNRRLWWGHGHHRHRHHRWHRRHWR